MAKRRHNSFEDEQIERAKRPKLNPPRVAPPNAPVGPKAMNGTTRTTIEQQQLVASIMPQGHMGSYNSNFGLNSQSYSGNLAYANAFPTFQELQQSQQAAAAYQQQYTQDSPVAQVPGLQHGMQPQHQYAQQMPNRQQHPASPRQYVAQQFVPSPSSQQRNPRKRKMQQAQSMSQVFKKHKTNHTSASTPQKRGQYPTENTPPPQSTLTSTSVPTSSVELPNAIPGNSNIQYTASSLQTQDRQSTESTPPFLSTLTGVSIPPSCAKPSDVIPNGAMLPLFVEYAHILFQKSVGGFGKVFGQMAEKLQQEMIRKAEEEGIRGLAEHVAKYAVWQAISIAELNRSNSVVFQKASFIINKARKDPYEDDELASGEDQLQSEADELKSEEVFVTETSETQIGLPSEFDSSCCPAFTAMIEAVHNTRPPGKIQCCRCRGWGRHGKGNCPVLTGKEELNMNAMNKGISIKQDDILKDSKFDTFLQDQTSSTPTLSGIPYIRKDGRIRTNWATSHVPLVLQQEDFNFYAINSHYFNDAASMYQAVVPNHLRFESVQVSTGLDPSVRGPLMLMNIQRESRKLLVDRPEQLVDPLWEICLDTLNIFSSSWQTYTAAQRDDVHLLGKWKKRSELAMGAAIHKADVFLANLLFFKADAEKLLELMRFFEKQQDELMQIKVAPDPWCGTTEFGSFDNIRQILDARLKLHDGFEAYMGILGQRFADWFLSDYFMKSKTAQKALAKEFFPGLTRLFACRLDPYAHLGSYCPPRWTIAQGQKSDGSSYKYKTKMAWGDCGLVEPILPEYLDLFLENPKNFLDSFTTTDVHDFGYVHDQMLFCNSDFRTAVASLHCDKQTYQENKDRKQGKVAGAKQKLEDYPLSWDANAKPRFTPGGEPNERDKIIEKMAFDAKYAFWTLVASPTIAKDYESEDNVKARAGLPGLSVLDVHLCETARFREKIARKEAAMMKKSGENIEETANDRTMEEICRIGAVEFLTPDSYEHPLNDFNEDMPDFKDEAACNTWAANLGRKWNQHENFQRLVDAETKERLKKLNKQQGSGQPQDEPVGAISIASPVRASSTSPVTSYTPAKEDDLAVERAGKSVQEHVVMAAASITSSNHPHFAQNSAATPQRLTSTNTPPVVSEHSLHKAHAETATVVTPSKQPQSREMSPREAELKAALLARRAATKKAKEAQQPASSSTQGRKLASKRSREDEDTEKPPVKRPRTANGDAPIAPSSSQPTEPNRSMSPPALIVSAPVPSLPTAAMHSPAKPSPLRQEVIQRDMQAVSFPLTSMSSPIFSNVSPRSPPSPTPSEENPMVSARKRKRDADDSDPIDQSLVTKRRALSSKRNPGSSTVAPHEKKEKEAETLLPAFLGPDGKVQVNICKDRFSVRRIRVSKTVDYELLDFDMVEVEEPDYTVY
ncbi:hypothetical protein BLS_001388 [Venturia inaequalis]|uniref:Uncharacterized protein n=1 Tax=Venturia inaequalis TaxID=5025 RepID=A0A8H3YXB8_VENIN|nr:hypothetical protein BLS_001388 [Venturia inaequalis]RDI85158.1 hypothetical protein Vi05172_g4687 [Venturia inaequalis]